MRAAHLLLDHPPIFADTLAARLCGVDQPGALRAQLERTTAEIAQNLGPEQAPRGLRELMASVIVRGRYVEDQLEQAMARGVEQYVILGAGLDSFAYRRGDLTPRLRVFEVDHPATQAWKRARLGELGIAPPPKLAYVPVNFERESTIAALTKSGFRRGAPALFSWLGVTAYLNLSAVHDVLRMIAGLATGTEVIFSYALPAETLDGETRSVLAFIKGMAAARGEPMISFFEPDWLAAQVRDLGFSEVWDFGPKEAAQRYYSGRLDGLRPPEYASLMGARV